jgi:hypothetical protein
MRSFLPYSFPLLLVVLWQIGVKRGNKTCTSNRHAVAHLLVEESRFFILFLFVVTVCGPKRDEVTGEWRKLHNEELRDLYSSPSIIRMINPRTMRWAGHVARTGR